MTLLLRFLLSFCFDWENISTLTIQVKLIHNYPRALAITCLSQNYIIGQILVASFKILRIFNFKHFYFACREDRETYAFILIWNPSCGSQLRSWCTALVCFKLLPNVKQRKNPLEECSSEATYLKPALLNCLNALSDVTKKSGVKASTSSLV